MVNQQTTDDHDRNLSAEDLAALRENLHEQRLFRQEQLEQLSASATTRAAASPERRSASQTEVRVTLTATARMVLAEVEAALARMDQDTYGTCRLCRGPVALARLMIVPQARHCAHCQQALEAGR
ncbi:TraR/DksA family transcriptional regulator [Streptomyces sp. NPDC090083]|uniref:TraR/DksA family transcriptional regulator n=1 Tax=Streptomyces sp. NPDC090083 TaxID=3365941 RepID=UPI00380A16C2